MEGGGVLRIDRFIHKLDHRGKGGFLLVIKGVFSLGNYSALELGCLETWEVSVDHS